MRTRLLLCRRLAHLLTWGAVVAAAGCGGDSPGPSGPPVPAALRVVGGEAQEGTVGAALAQPIVVEVTDAGGRAVADASVSWTVEPGSGQVDRTSTRTGRDGRATVAWTLGGVPGAQQLTARISSTLSVLVAATAAAGPAAQLLLAPDSTDLAAGDTVRLQPTARDAFANATSLPALTWSSSASGVATVSGGLVTAAGPGTATITASAGGVSAKARVRVPVPAGGGAIALSIEGLPAGVPTVTITGPSFTVTVRNSGTVPVPVAGEYTLTAARSAHGHLMYAAETEVQVVEVADGSTAEATVRYVVEVLPLTPGQAFALPAAPLNALRYYRVDVPAGMARLTVSSSGGSGDLDLYLMPGTLPTAENYRCVSDEPSTLESCTVAAPEAGAWYVLAHAWAAYTGVQLRADLQQGGSLRVELAGLPQGATGEVLVSGPESYQRTVTSSQSLPALLPGTYTLQALPVTHGGGSWVPTPGVQEAAVTAGAEVQATVEYAAAGSGVNLAISALHITQGIQNLSGAVPLVEGREGLLRLFGYSTHAGLTPPPVRVRVYHGALVLDTLIFATNAATALTVDEAALGASWNLRLPGALIRPGMTVDATIDPGDVVAESNEEDNTYPGEGAAREFDVRTAPVHRARLVPVRQTGNGLQGDVTTANAASYMSVAQGTFPFPGIDVDVRAPYQFTGTISSAYDATWTRLLSEIAGLRAADGDTRYYYGVLKPGYTSGGSGLGYIAYPAAIGIDWAPYRSYTLAHEWGHNFGRLHVDCGGATATDPMYPYAGGLLGMHGWDPTTGAIRNGNTTYDLMSYCSPGWASDYTYAAVMAFRGAGQGATTAAEPGLLVWGRITPEGVVLEPAFEVVARPSVPKGSGSYRLEARDASGAALFAFSFDGLAVDHLADERHFAFVVPLRSLGGRRPAELLVRSPRGQAVQQARAAGVAAGPGAEPRLTRRGADRARLTWNAAQSPVVMVRDPRSGLVLSFARGGDVELMTTAPELEVFESDGVRSSGRRLRVER